MGHDGCSHEQFYREPCLGVHALRNTVGSIWLAPEGANVGHPTKGTGATSRNQGSCGSRREGADLEMIETPTKAFDSFLNRTARGVLECPSPVAPTLSDEESCVGG
jgi:hypothetical protein